MKLLSLVVIRIDITTRLNSSRLSCKLLTKETVQVLWCLVLLSLVSGWYACNIQQCFTRRICSRFYVLVVCFGRGLAVCPFEDLNRNLILQHMLCVLLREAVNMYIIHLLPSSLGVRHYQYFQYYNLLGRASKVIVMASCCCGLGGIRIKNVFHGEWCIR